MSQFDADAGAALAALTHSVRESLRKLGEPFRPWTAPRPEIDADVLIVGAGQSGLAAAFALKRVGVASIRVVSADDLGQEGPWRTFARMPTLRSPKQAPGPELGLSDLAYENWHIARFGQADYAALGLIPTELWADYLDWFRMATGISVETGKRMVDLAGAGLGDVDGVAAHFADGSKIVARQVILATGMGALGGPAVPSFMAGIPSHIWATADGDIDFGALKDKHVAVLGAASSAFDNAAAALEAGAAKVDLYCRNETLNEINHMKGVADYGLVAHWADLDDDRRWRLARHGVRRAAPPTGATVARSTRWPNFYMHMAAPWEDVQATEDGKALRIKARDKWQNYDFAIIAIGYTMDAAQRPELAHIFNAMARWGDRYTPPPPLAAPKLAAYPYLTRGFAFTECAPGTAPWLARVRLFAGPAVVSMGRIVGESGNLRYGAPRLATAITKALAIEVADTLIARAEAFDERDVTPSDYAASVSDPES